MDYVFNRVGYRWYLGHAVVVRLKLKLHRLKPDGIWVTRSLLG